MRLQRLPISVLLTVAFLLIALVIALAFWPQPTRTLVAGSHTYHLEIADTNAARAKGLSGRTSLAADNGMLFVFSRPAVQCFWMKNTHVPLDMIWLDSARKVVHLESNVQPSSYPHQYCPDTPARYVIELKAGQAATSGIHTGQQLNF